MYYLKQPFRISSSFARGPTLHILHVPGIGTPFNQVISYSDNSIATEL